MGDIVVIAVDVGSLPNVGWWRAKTGAPGEGGRDLDALIDAVISDVERGDRVALGIEAPLFVLLPASTAGLNKQRVGGHGRPWCAGAWTGALALRVQQAAYIFAGIARRTGPLPVSFEIAALVDSSATLVVWEAFVSGRSKNRSAIDPHVDDARRAVAALSDRLASGAVHSDIDEANVMNLAAAGLLTAGLTTDVRLLRQPCVVVKPLDYIPSP